MGTFASNLKVRQSLAILCAVLLPVQQSFGWQQPPPQAQPEAGDQQALLAPEQLDSLVAPIALYPDPLLSQVLVASTYPLEIVEADRWFKQNSKLTGKDLTAAASKQTWDASVQALVVFPDVLKQLDQNIGWTTDLGNAFLAQQAGVMEAVQRLRQKAQLDGKLQSTPQQTVTMATENNANYVEIQPADPQVIYVPQYDPVAVWGAPPPYYPYPPIVYPSTGAVIAAGAISFGVGMAVGALWSGGGGWGWNCGWGHNTVVVNNNFINNNHFNRVNVANGNVWQHNAAHRAGVPYANRNVANRYNQANINRANINRPTVNQTQQRLNQQRVNQADRSMGQRPNAGQAGKSAAQRPAGGAVQRPQGGAARNPGLNQNRPAQRPSTGSADRVGNRQVSGQNFGGGRSAFSDMNQGAKRAQMNSSRGAASARRSGGGGGGRSRGGGRR
jgi:hypothetical protein